MPPGGEDGDVGQHERLKREREGHNMAKLVGREGRRDRVERSAG